MFGATCLGFHPAAFFFFKSGIGTWPPLISEAIGRQDDSTSSPSGVICKTFEALLAKSVCPWQDCQFLHFSGL